MTEMRNRRFTARFRKALAEERLREATDKLLERVMSAPVERGFYVSVDHVVVMDRRRREGTLPRMSEMRREMWEAIFAALDAMLAENPAMTRVDAAAEVVATATAPRFYISRRVAQRLVDQSKNL